MVANPLAASLSLAFEISRACLQSELIPPPACVTRSARGRDWGALRQSRLDWGCETAASGRPI